MVHGMTLSIHFQNLGHGVGSTNSVHREGERDGSFFKKLFLLIFQTIEDN